MLSQNKGNAVKNERSTQSNKSGHIPWASISVALAKYPQNLIAIKIFSVYGIQLSINVYNYTKWCKMNLIFFCNMEIFKSHTLPPQPPPPTNHKKPQPKTKHHRGCSFKRCQILAAPVEVDWYSAQVKLGSYSGFHKPLWCFMYTKLRVLVISTRHGWCLQSGTPKIIFW